MDSSINKLRILIVISNLEVGGGAQRVATTIGNELTRRGYELHLLTFYEYPRTYPYHGIYHSRGERAKPWWRKPLGVLARVWGIARVCRENDIDVAVAFLPEASFYTLASKLLFFNRRKMIVLVRNNPNNRNWLYRFLIRLLYPLADQVVPNARATEQILQEEYGLKNTTTIYNPIDLDAVEKKAEEPLPEEYEWIKYCSPLFISVGRLTKQKGQWHMIRAFQKVVEEKPNATLIILGEGGLRAKLEKLIQDCGLKSNVFLLGNQENVYPFLKASDCFVFTSLWEGLPNVLIEALAVGLPIISTDCQTGPREIVAPELPVSGKVEYPYEASCGILSAVPSFEEIWEPLKTVSSTVEEEMLAGIMRKNVVVASRPLERCHQEFGTDSIIQQWMSEIKSI